MLERHQTLLLAAVLLPLGACHEAFAEGPEPFGKLSVEEVSQSMGKPGVAIFDDNSEDTFKEGHIPGAKWLAVSEVEAARLPQDKAAKLIFYCANPH
jgi:hypothetical protein